MERGSAFPILGPAKENGQWMDLPSLICETVRKPACAEQTDLQACRVTQAHTEWHEAMSNTITNHFAILN